MVVLFSFVHEQRGEAEEEEERKGVPGTSHVEAEMMVWRSASTDERGHHRRPDDDDDEEEVRKEGKD